MMLMSTADKEQIGAVILRNKKSGSLAPSKIFKAEITDGLYHFFIEIPGNQGLFTFVQTLYLGQDSSQALDNLANALQAGKLGIDNEEFTTAI